MAVSASPTRPPGLEPSRSRATARHRQRLNPRRTGKPTGVTSHRTRFAVAIVLLGLLPAGLASAQDQRVVVTATRVPTPLERLPAAVTVIDRQTIDERGYQTLGDALSAVPGLFVSRQGGIGQPSSLFVRGTESRHVLVLIDGVPANDPSDPSGRFDLSNDLLGDLERIEVVRGPSSSLYGSGAIGGVVNLVTRRPEAGFRPQVAIEGGNRRTVRAEASAAGREGPVGFAFGAEGLSTQGEDTLPDRIMGGGVERDGRRYRSGFARVNLDAGGPVLGDASLRFREARAAFDGEFPGRAQDPDLSVKNRLFTGTAGVKLATEDRQSWLRLGTARAETKRRQEDGVEPEGSFPFAYRYKGVTQDFTLDGVWNRGELGPFRLASFTGGVLDRRESIATLDEFDTDGEPRGPRSRAGFAGFQGRLWERLDVTLSARHERPDAHDSTTTWQAGGRYRVPSIGTTLRGSYGTAFKAPSPFQLFDPFSGNEELEAERSRSWEVGFETDLGSEERPRLATVGVSYFRTRIEELITFDSSTFRYTNVDEARIEGVETSLVVRPAGWVEATLAWTWTDAEDATSGVRLERRPRHVGSVNVVVRPVERFTVAPELVVTGPFREARYGSDGAQTGVDYRGGTALVNLRAAWRLDEVFTATATVRNLGGATYEPNDGYRGEGRLALIGLRAAW